MLGRALLLFTLLLTPLDAFSYVEVAFFEFVDPYGTVTPLEAGGRFYHVAISHKGQWLHADPQYDAVLMNHSEMQRYGRMTIIAIPEFEEPTEAQVAKLLGTEFDSTYTWDKPGTTYCAKLVAQLLNIAPRPMQFSGKHFEDSKWTVRRGELGLSPDDIHEDLVRRSQRLTQTRTCQKAFR